MRHTPRGSPARDVAPALQRCLQPSTTMTYIRGASSVPKTLPRSQRRRSVRWPRRRGGRCATGGEGGRAPRRAARRRGLPGEGGRPRPEVGGGRPRSTSPAASTR
jgi:hypothetical protein